MGIFNDIVEYSGWLATLLGVIYIFVQRSEARRNKLQTQQLSEMLANASSRPVLLGADPEGSSKNWPVSTGHSQRLRTILIRAAAGNQSLRTVLAHQGSDGDPEELMTIAQMLADRGLLRFDAPLSLDTPLHLKV